MGVECRRTYNTIYTKLVAGVLPPFFPFPCRQLSLFHSFGWLQETVEHILVSDGQMEAAQEQVEEEVPHEDDDAAIGEA